jgi:hypothetical protein
VLICAGKLPHGDPFIAGDLSSPGKKLKETQVMKDPLGSGLQDPIPNQEVHLKQTKQGPELLDPSNWTSYLFGDASLWMDLRAAEP